MDLCGWTNLNLSAFEWLPSSGADAYWIGGPKKDQTDGTKNGGYAFFETSQLPNAPDAANQVSAMLASPVLQSTGSNGHCVTFSYAMDGLSADKLRVLLHPELPAAAGSKKSDSSLALDNESLREDGARLAVVDEVITLTKENFELNFRDNQVLGSLQDGTRGLWKAAQVMYSYPMPHKVSLCFLSFTIYPPPTHMRMDGSDILLHAQIILEAIPKDETDQARKYRGYIAIDDLVFKDGEACQGHCTFDAGMCGFLNDNTKDDFDWEVVSTVKYSTL